MVEISSKKSFFFSDVFAGAGIGLLLGTVVALSNAPVVATVVGALTSLLALFLGLDEKSSTARLPSVNALRIGAFGFATVAGLALGLYVRINNPLAEDPSVAIARWNNAFPENPSLARQMMVYERTALAPAKLTYDQKSGTTETVSVNAAVSGAKQPVLYGSLSDYDACTRLDPVRFATADDALAAYGRGDPPKAVRVVAETIKDLPVSERALAVHLAHQIMCEIQIEESE